MNFPPEKHRGILFIGDSYTWGEGLYFYSGLDGLKFNENHEYQEDDLRDVFHSYRKKYRFPKLVADSLNTWEWTSDIGNGGSIINRYVYVIQDNMYWGHIKYDDFDTLVWQLTDPMRDFYGGYQKLNTFYSSDEERIDVYNNHLKRLINFINNCSREWENRGKKVVIVSYSNDFIDYSDITDEFIKRYCYIEYENKKYKSILDFINKDKTKENSNNYFNEPTLTVRDDFSKYGYQINDFHLNKEGHRILADSIIKKIKEYE